MGGGGRGGKAAGVSALLPVSPLLPTSPITSPPLPVWRTRRRSRAASWVSCMRISVCSKSGESSPEESRLATASSLEPSEETSPLDSASFSFSASATAAAHAAPPPAVGSARAASAGAAAPSVHSSPEDRAPRSPEERAPRSPLPRGSPRDSRHGLAAPSMSDPCMSRGAGAQ